MGLSETREKTQVQRLAKICRTYSEILIFRSDKSLQMKIQNLKFQKNLILIQRRWMGNRISCKKWIFKKWRIPWWATKGQALKLRHRVHPFSMRQKIARLRMNLISLGNLFAEILTLPFIECLSSNACLLINDLKLNKNKWSTQILQQTTKIWKYSRRSKKQWKRCTPSKFSSFLSSWKRRVWFFLNKKLL